MANVDIKFLDEYDPTDFIQVKSHKHGELIYVTGEFRSNRFSIIMDISTAIKFSKAVRTEINNAKPEYNG